MVYLTNLATRYQRLVYLALSANYVNDVFNTDSSLRITPAIMSRMKVFSDEMANYGAYLLISATRPRQPDIPR